jgi:hypothetical protein
MPLHFCHPSAPHKRLRLPEWFISNLMLERALDAVVRRVHRLDREHDIPYLAGYSVDGTIIYIDRDMPKGFRSRGRMVETDRFLVLHEEVEKTMIDRLNLHYLHAHQIAARAEQAAVRACGINWREYDAFMQDNVKHAGDKRLSKVPADLDLKPYRDEHDTELLVRMAAAVERGEHPETHHRDKLHRAVHATIAHIKANGGSHHHLRHGSEPTGKKAKGAKAARATKGSARASSGKSAKRK